MRDEDIARALQRIAEREVAQPVDLWPAIAPQVRRREPARWSPARLAIAGTVVVTLVAGSLAVARLFAVRQPGTPAVMAPPEGPAVSYVVPEVFPDLAALVAASDLVVRGRATGAYELAVDQVILDRLQLDPGQVDLRRPEMPPDLERPPEDPPLQLGHEYVLFLVRRYPYAADARDAQGGSPSFRPVGGAQGQWLVRDGVVVQAADVPLGAHDGEPVEQFVAAIASAPDLRAQAAELLREHGWSPGEPIAVAALAAPSVEQIARGADVKAWLEASQRIGLDWEPFAGQPVLHVSYELDPRGVSATVYVAEGRPVGAWLRAGEWGLTFGLDQRDEALATLGKADLRPTSGAGVDPGQAPAPPPPPPAGEADGDGG